MNRKPPRRLFPMQAPLIFSCDRFVLLAAAAHKHTFPVTVVWSTQAVVALIAGLLILIRPKLLNFIVALYLIVIGLVGLLHLHW